MIGGAGGFFTSNIRRSIEAGEGDGGYIGEYVAKLSGACITKIQWHS